MHYALSTESIRRLTPHIETLKSLTDKYSSVTQEGHHSEAAQEVWSWTMEAEGGHYLGAALQLFINTYNETEVAKLERLLSLASIPELLKAEDLKLVVE